MRDRFPIAIHVQTNEVHGLVAHQAQGLQHGQDLVATHGRFQRQRQQAIDERIDQAGRLFAGGADFLLHRRGGRRVHARTTQ
ncbi:hypothetical protein D3C81_1759250 [compost metagenome]